MRTLAGQLGIDVSNVIPGYEDTWYYLWRERRLPVNVDPFESRLDNEMERARLRRVFDQGLDAAVGYVLPLRRGDDEKWATSRWFLRDERMHLIPGDSPMGSGCRWIRCRGEGGGPAGGDRARSVRGAGGVADGDSVEVAAPPHPSPLPRARAREAARYSPGEGAASKPPERQEPAKDFTRTALCIEVRDPHAPTAPRPRSRTKASKAASSTSSCPPSRPSRPTSSSSPPSSTPPPSCACPSCSRATRRRATRA